ncbi:GNAT family N-acetyltransferase [Anaerorhabdus sp.]|uniref:GNAT family N-acetyltransferase n=1 Tax=Anaerorhabdus sp. TaxID=1872524 RepID=UPI002FCBB744
MKTLETERLWLRPWKESDIDDFFGYASMEGLGEFAGWPPHKSIEESKQILQQFIESNQEYAVVCKSNNKAIGSIAAHNKKLDAYKELDQRMLGYCLNKDYWGQGIMTEAVSRLHEYLFNDVGIDMLWVEHFLENNRSKNVILKTGYEYTCDSIYNAEALNKQFNCHQYILTKEKFQKINGIKKEFPILEFDENEVAFINPSILVDKYKPFPERLVVCFFHEVIDRLVDEGKLELYEVIEGENKVYLYKFITEDCLVVKGYVGGAGCGGEVEECIALGSKQITFCGGAGSLHPDITVGKIVVINAAVRDDGLSYHYMKPSREVYANEEILTFTQNYLDKNNIEYVTGKVWTTDAFYRETKDKIQLRSKENCLMVEMEQAGLLALTQFRKVNYIALIYGGDDLTKEEWDQRSWKDRKDVREDLLYLCKDLSKEMAENFRG